MSNLTQDNIQCIVQSLAELDSLADIVIVDTGAGISDAVMEFLVASGEILLVTTPEPTSITDSYSLLNTAIPFRFTVSVASLFTNLDTISLYASADFA